MFLYSMGRSVFAITAAVCLASAALAQVAAAHHVVLVIDENSSFSDVIANMPWLVGQGYANGYAKNYKSDNGGSLLDYLWLASGSCESAANCTLPRGTHDFHCNGNNCYYPGTTTSDPITDDNIFRELNRRGISWKVYAQSYQEAGGTVTTPDNNNGTSYYRRHNGATWYSDVLSNVAGSANKVVDLSHLTADLAAHNLPRFMIIIPDGNHDAHDCPLGMSTCTEAEQLAAADAFLQGTLDAILSTPDFQPGGTGLILVTFDECGGGTNQGCGAAVYTALIGPQIAPHTVSSRPYKHENALRTILDSLGVATYPGATARAAAMWDFFAVSGTQPEVVVGSPANSASLSSPITIQASGFPTAGHAIGGWRVYVDSVDKYRAGNVDSIHPKISMSTGTHTVVVRAWDNSGAYGDQTLEVTVASPMSTVSVSTPTNNATVGSPVNIHASALPTAGQTIGGWWIYVDGVGVYNAGSVNAINANVAIGPGTHTVVIRAWDTSTAYGDQTRRLTVADKPAVAVSTPTFGSNVVSPLKIAASAQPSSGHSISGWRIYLDSVGVYQAGSANSLNANIGAPPGTHTLVVRAWETSGAYGEQTFMVNVQPVAVNIKTPANAAPVTSPVKLVAKAVSRNPITGWQIYVDSDDAYTQDFGDLVDASLPMSPGTHTVIVRAWDRSGAYGDQTITVTIP